MHILTARWFISIVAPYEDENTTRITIGGTEKADD